jgi:hypothetical protein
MSVANVPRNGMRPVHPGEVLREDYLKPLSMSANAWRRRSAYPHQGSTMWFVSGAASRLIRPCGWSDISVAMRVRG